MIYSWYVERLDLLAACGLDCVSGAAKCGMLLSPCRPYPDLITATGSLVTLSEYGKLSSTFALVAFLIQR